MAATGTIAVTNNSKSITGTDTNFTTELAAADIIYTVIQGVNWSFVVDTIASDTSLTITAAYTGNAVSGQQFTAIPRMALTGITGQLAVDTAMAIRGLNYDKANWQQILTSPDNATVNLPDRSQYTGPSWLSLANSLSGINDSLGKKANTSDLGDAAKKNTGITLGTVAAGDDKRLNTIDGKSGGKITSRLTSASDLVSAYTYGDATQGRWSSQLIAVLSGWGKPSNAPDGVDGAYASLSAINPSNGAPVQGQITVNSTWQGRKDWTFQADSGNASAPGSWVNNSDNRIKTDVKTIQDPLNKMPKIRGTTWTRTDFENMTGIGFIAQSVQRIFPESVFESGSRKLLDGTEVEGILSPDTSGVSAALHHEALLTMMSIQRKALLTLADATLTDEDKQSALTELANLIPDESEYAEQ